MDLTQNLVGARFETFTKPALQDKTVPNLHRIYYPSSLTILAVCSRMAWGPMYALTTSSYNKNPGLLAA